MWNRTTNIPDEPESNTSYKSADILSWLSDEVSAAQSCHQLCCCACLYPAVFHGVV